MALYTTPVFNINLKKLAANYRLLEKLSAPAIPAAVVKDDAYGLGAAEVAAALYAAGCRRFFRCSGCRASRLADQKSGRLSPHLTHRSFYRDHGSRPLFIPRDL